MESTQFVIVTFVVLAFNGQVCVSVCPQLPLPIGTYFTDAPVTYGNNEAIAVACNLSYVATGGTSNGKCSSNSWTWGTSGMLQCTRGCLAPSLTRGVEYVSGTASTSYLPATAVSLKCSTNYGKIGGSATGTCNGTTYTWSWSAGKQLECDPACPTITLTTGVELGSASSSQYTMGDVISLRCSSGYASTGGGNSATCLSNNTWQWNGTGSLQCSRACPPPSLKNGTEFASGLSSQYTVDDIITLRCSSGYTSTGGGASAVCLANNTWQWNENEMIQCSPACLPPTAGVNAAISGSALKAIYIANDTIKFECANGYVPQSGSATGVCTSISQWMWEAGASTTLSCVIAPPYKDRDGDTFKESTCKNYVIRSAPTPSTCLISCLNDGYCRGHVFDGDVCYLDRPLLESTVSSSKSCFTRQ